MTYRKSHGGILIWPVLAVLGFAFSLRCPRLLAQEAPGAAGAMNYQAATRHLAFRSIGPANMDGRIDAFAVPEGEPNVIYVASATGGVWKSVNGGTTWKPVFDQEPVSSIGAIAIAPSDPSIVWVGTGEANNRQSSSWGDGVYRSTDAGNSWTHMGLDDTLQISRIAIDPTNSQVVYVAALGDLWGPNQARGLYKTSDGGKTWTKVLSIDENTGIADVEMEPKSPGTLYAAAYERRRTVYGMNGGGPASALYKTTDGSATWKKLVKGLPYENGGDTGRIGVSIYPRDPRIVYARVEYGGGGAMGGGGVYRSEDAGDSWEKMSEVDPRPSYFSQILVDPNNYLRVWLPGGGLAHSDDGGKTFQPNPSQQGLQTIHADFHAVWIDPDNSHYMIAGSDGGVYISRDGGVKWDYINTIPVGQVYQVATDTENPYHICGGFQDNGSWCGPVRTRNPKGITNDDWYRVMDGDGFYVVPDPKDPNIVFVEAQGGKLIRLNRQTNEWTPIRPLPDKISDPPYRWQWNSPLVATAAGSLYAGANVVFKSTDEGNTWAKISPDLTTHIDPANLPILGVMPSSKMLERDYGVSSYPCLTAISVSPLSEKVIWAGAEDGSLQVTRDGGQNWTSVAGGAGLPKATYVSSITASRFAEGTAYVTFDGHRNGDYGIYVFRTDDYGKTWQQITQGLPNDRGTALVIREDPYNRDLLFLGSEFALHASFDRGSNWIPLKMGLPPVLVDDITVEPRSHDLVLATHGRAFWVLDDIRPLEQLNPNVLSSPLSLFDIRPATEWKLFDHGNGYTGDQLFLAPNPPDGAIIDYYLAHSPAKGQAVKISVLDQSGKLIQEFDGTGEAGINRVAWDLRYSTPIKPSQSQLDAEYEGFFFNAVLGPFVSPGTYTVQVSVGDGKASKAVTVADDPTIHMDAASRQERDQLTMQAYELYKRAVDVSKTITSVRTALDGARKSWKAAGAPSIPDDVQKAAEALSKQTGDLYSALVGPAGFTGPPLTFTPPPLRPQIARLLFTLEAVSQAPTAVQRTKLAGFTQLLDQKSAAAKQLVEVDLAHLNQMMNKAGIPHIHPALAPTATEESQDQR
ncbi:MAG TPA: hypothetical protein VGS20_09775 [Candidatus Acidoferrales bacterium]|nr:hypothetical protein [Candidatus Acidoferrales bacterium]